MADDNANGGAQGTSDSGGSQGSQGSQQGTSGAQGATAQSGSGDQSQQGNQQGTQRTGAQSGFTYSEDRSKWFPPHRFNEVNQKAQRVSELEAAIAEKDRKIAALAGTQPIDANAQKSEQIREAFFALPGMDRLRKFIELDDDKFNRLLETPDHVAQVQEAENRAWSKHGDESVGYIADAVADAMGSDLDDNQKQDLRDTFAAWIQRTASREIETTGRSSIVARYENGDKKLLDEFVTAYTKRWVDPARRTNTARTATRTRPVVNSTGRSAVTSTQRPAEFKNMDERIAYAAERAKELGVQFGR